MIKKQGWVCIYSMCEILVDVIKVFCYPHEYFFLKTKTPSHKRCLDSRSGMSCRLTEFTAMLQIAAAYRISGQEYVKARRENVIVKTQWHKQYSSSPFTYACVGSEVRTSLSGTGWGTCKAWLRFGCNLIQKGWSSLPAGSRSLQCLPWGIRLQAALFCPFLTFTRSTLKRE